MRVSVIGAGHVGLVVAGCVARLGNEVTLVEIDEQKVKTIREGRSPFFEPGLDDLLRQVDLKTTSDYRMAGSDVIFICVNTPSNEDGSIGLRDVVEAARQIAFVLKEERGYCVVAMKSSVVPGTTEKVIIPILESSGKTAGGGFGVCMTPEFLGEGRALHDFLSPARVVIGEYDQRSGDVLSALYRPLNAPVLRLNLRTAEMIKYASNAFLAARVSFINEIGNICKDLGIDTYEVARGMGFDERIGGRFLNAGIGFGGPCFPKDLKALIAMSKGIGYEPRLLEEILDVNQRQASRMVALLRKHVSPRGAAIGLLGLSFKPETDDVQNSIALTIADVLLKEGAVVKAYDPKAMENFRRLFPQIEYVSAEQVLKCDAVLIITEWEEFNSLDYEGKIVIDGRRVSKAKEARTYEGVCW